MWFWLSETIHQLMYARLKNVDIKTDRICSNLSLVHLQYWQITKMPFEKQSLFVAMISSVLLFFPDAMSLLSQSTDISKQPIDKELSYTAYWHVIHIYTNKKDPSSKVTPQIKCNITGLYDYFPTAVPNVLYKNNSFPADFAELQFENTTLFALHKHFVQPNWIQWFKDIVIYYAVYCSAWESPNIIETFNANYNRFLNYSRFPISTIVPAVSEYLDLTGSSDQLTFAHEKAL